MTGTARIVLVHATPVAMAPVHDAFAKEWPEAELTNLLDDGLTTERARQAELTEELIERFVDLVRYAYRTGADGILATCSAFGPAIDRAAASLPVPVVKPNEAMFRAALACGTDIGMLATFAPSVPTMADEFAVAAERLGSPANLTPIVVDSALDLLRAGDAGSHNRLVAEQAPRLADCDAIVLAHFSTSQAVERVRARVDVPVFTAPQTAVLALKDAVRGAA
ncbi:aspartate/glutamate racemase family protein [Streptomyces hygroscopicus]|uniref:aspartate/glutamate racemase family protein n=1 Tax=Streptomyces hygroscopicus TaxID=1912 RepID=UPI000825A5A4|nr:aspartate/glutamate racemase family protein [Streptomyces hygroscopicus]